MAEVAANVLHNVGNVLNSVNISCTVLCEKVHNSSISSVTQAAELLEKQGDALASFLTTHPSGRKLPEFLGKLAKWLKEEQASLLKELEVLSRNVDHIKEIIKGEQSYAEAGGLHETVKITSLVENAIQINAGALDKQGIKVIREYSEIPAACIQKHKLMQILINLIKNARDSLAESECPEKRLVVRAHCEEGRIHVSISDNGIGIHKENLTRIFAHGFTTKKQGNGFGLHSSALAAKGMGGSLAAQSDGLGRGATFLLELPLYRESEQGGAGESMAA
jgi:signal transduction histidine kinase